MASPFIFGNVTSLFFDDVTSCILQNIFGDVTSAQQKTGKITVGQNHLLEFLYKLMIKHAVNIVSVRSELDIAPDQLPSRVLPILVTIYIIALDNGK